MAAQAAVFNTAELLEAILLPLPTRTLLGCQRVCRTFKATIDESPALQRALFFLPGTAEDVCHIHYSYQSPQYRFNYSTGRGQTDYKLITVTPYHLSHEEATADIPPSILPQSARKTGITINPLLVEWGTAQRCIHKEQPRISISTAQEARFRHHLINVPEYASCRRMYISQPPLPFKNVYATTPWPVGPSHSFWAETFNPGGGKLFGEVLLQAWEGMQRDRVEPGPWDSRGADAWQWWEFWLARPTKGSSSSVPAATASTILRALNNLQRTSLPHASSQIWTQVPASFQAVSQAPLQSPAAVKRPKAARIGLIRQVGNALTSLCVIQ